jgi:hypothetical protein
MRSWGVAKRESRYNIARIYFRFILQKVLKNWKGKDLNKPENKPRNRIAQHEIEQNRKIFFLDFIFTLFLTFTRFRQL